MTSSNMLTNAEIESKIEKIEDWERLSAEPLVSVRVATYNHERYIAQCLDGILMQEAHFPYEILIKEDNSTDRTREIVRAYQAQHPDKIRLWLCRENLYSQGIKASAIIMPACRGTYQALCEGDDYWTDPLKLQKQVEFLEAHPDYVMCFHNSVVIDQDGHVIRDSLLKEHEKKDRSQAELKRAVKIPTQTRCFRHVVQSCPPESGIAFGGDKFLTSVLGNYGKAKYMPEIQPACFREHDGGINSSKIGTKQKKVNAIRTRVALFLYYERNNNVEMRDYYLSEMKRLLVALEKFGQERDWRDAFLSRIKQLICRG